MKQNQIVKEKKKNCYFLKSYNDLILFFLLIFFLFLSSWFNKFKFKAIFCIFSLLCTMPNAHVCRVLKRKTWHLSYQVQRARTRMQSCVSGSLLWALQRLQGTATGTHREKMFTKAGVLKTSWWKYCLKTACKRDVHPNRCHCGDKGVELWSVGLLRDSWWSWGKAGLLEGKNTLDRAFGVAEDPAWTGEVEFTAVRNEQINT